MSISKLITEQIQRKLFCKETTRRVVHELITLGLRNKENGLIVMYQRKLEGKHTKENEIFFREQ